MTKTPKSTKRMQSVQAYLEIGHWAWCRSPEKRQKLKTHDWVLFVKGKEEKQPIHHFVEKVVFHLHESFVPSIRVITEPPYQISESGYGSFIVTIEVHFRMKESGQRSMQTYNHDLTLPAEGNPPIELALTEKLTFTLVSEDFIEMVLKGGGEIIQSSVSNRVASKPSSNFSRSQLKIESKSKLLKQQKRKFLKDSVEQNKKPQMDNALEENDQPLIKKASLNASDGEKESISRDLFQDTSSINKHPAVSNNNKNLNNNQANNTNKELFSKEWRSLKRLCQQITSLKGNKARRSVLLKVYQLLSSNLPSTDKSGDKVFNLCQLNKETYNQIKMRLKV